MGKLLEVMILWMVLQILYPNAPLWLVALAIFGVSILDSLLKVRFGE